MHKNMESAGNDEVCGNDVDGVRGVAVNEQWEQKRFRKEWNIWGIV